MNGEELWKSDGTEAGTEMVKNIRIGGDNDPQEFFVSATRCFLRQTTVSTAENCGSPMELGPGQSW